MARRGSAGGDGDALPAELPDDLADDPDVDPESAARTICLRLLTVRSRTRSELADALRARHVPDAATERVLQRFTDVGLIDDAAFAATFASTRLTERGLARSEIARQLRTKGVAEDDVMAAVAGIDANTERETAHRLAERRFRSMSHLEPVVATRRLVGMLSRKGYRPGLAVEVAHEVVKDTDIGTHLDDTG